MEIILIILTGTILGAFFIGFFFLGYYLGSKNTKENIDITMAISAKLNIGKS